LNRDKKVEKEKKRRRRKEKTSKEDEVEEMEEEVMDEVENLTVSKPVPSLASAFTMTQSKTSSDEVTPRPRMNPIMTIRNGVLFLWGGIIEDGDKQFTLSDFYALDLHKLDRWQVIIPDDSLNKVC
jgi:hypothetical protein